MGYGCLLDFAALGQLIHHVRLVSGFCSSGYDFAIPSSRLYLTIQTLGVAIGFVGNYAPCGLSPQTDGMPVIQKKTAAESSAAVVLLVLCAGIFSAVLHRSQRKSFTDFVPHHFVSNFLLQTSYQRPTIFHHIGPMPRKQIRNRIEQTKPTFHHSGWVI